MPISNPTTAGQRFYTKRDYSEMTVTQPNRRLIRINPKNSGRNSYGRITTRHQGGRHKRFLRLIDWKRQQRTPGIVTTIEYDPNRTANIALISYPDGSKSYILAPDGLKVSNRIIAGENAEPQVGNALPLSHIPVGTTIHNLEIVPGKGGQVARSAGTSALIQGREENYVLIKLTSGEIKRFSPLCYATIGQLSHAEWKTAKLGKAGRTRHMGIRPSVRGIAQHPAAHPHGGGEGRSGIGMPSPKTPWVKKP